MGSDGARGAGFSPPARHGRAGFSVIEVLIAAGIFLAIAVGLLPLFVNAIRNNVAGREATDVSNMGKSRVEELFQLPFDSPRLSLPGATTELLVTDYYVALRDTSGPLGGVGYWTTEAPATSQVAPWVRTTRVRQYNLNDLTEPLPGDTDPGQVHLKEIQVEIQGRRAIGNPLLGGRRELTLRIYKAK
jgi:type II secretory pathway pseudopilin PulG